MGWIIIAIVQNKNSDVSFVWKERWHKFLSLVKTIYKKEVHLQMILTFDKWKGQLGQFEYIGYAGTGSVDLVMVRRKDGKIFRRINVHVSAYFIHVILSSYSRGVRHFHPWCSVFPHCYFAWSQTTTSLSRHSQIAYLDMEPFIFAFI